MDTLPALLPGSQTARVCEIDEPRDRDEGPAILRMGFRPFFLGASLWAAAALVLWLSVFLGYFELPTAFDTVAWHAHEMLFGFIVAAIAGFVLTAIPNWIGRLPINGMPLLGLFLLWLLGRVATGLSAVIGIELAAILDLSFLLALLLVILREIIAGRSWRNLPIVAAIAALFLANALMHMEQAGLMPAESIGQRLGIGIVVLLVSLIGGRVIPSFTRNWLVKRGENALPVPFGRFDGLCLLLVLGSVVTWTIYPNTQICDALLILAGVASMVRLCRWCGRRTLSEPLVWSLHIGFMWIPLGLILLGLSGFVVAIAPSAGLHALTAGAAGSMILAVMTRATLGHTGRVLTADRYTTAIYCLVFLAAALRVAVALLQVGYLPLLAVSAGAWVGAFTLFALRYGPMLAGGQKTP